MEAEMLLQRGQLVKERGRRRPGHGAGRLSPLDLFAS